MHSDLRKGDQFSGSFPLEWVDESKDESMKAGWLDPPKASIGRSFSCSSQYLVTVGLACWVERGIQK